MIIELNLNSNCSDLPRAHFSFWWVQKSNKTNTKEQFIRKTWLTNHSFRYSRKKSRSGRQSRGKCVSLVYMWNWLCWFSWLYTYIDISANGDVNFPLTSFHPNTKQSSRHWKINKRGNRRTLTATESILIYGSQISMW